MRVGGFLNLVFGEKGVLMIFLFFLVKEGRLDLNNVVNYFYNEVCDIYLVCFFVCGIF